MLGVQPQRPQRPDGQPAAPPVLHGELAYVADADQKLEEVYGALKKEVGCKKFKTLGTLRS